MAGPWWIGEADLDDDQKDVISLVAEGNHLVLGPPGLRQDEHSTPPGQLPDAEREAEYCDSGIYANTEEVHRLRREGIRIPGRKDNDLHQVAA